MPIPPGLLLTKGLIISSVGNVNPGPLSATTMLTYPASLSEMSTNIVGFFVREYPSHQMELSKTFIRALRTWSSEHTALRPSIRD